MGYYLAIDIEETSGHLILGHLENGKMQMEEIYQFKNGIVEIEGKKCWDLFYVFNEIKIGIKRCREIGKLPIFIGIDTWGEDFVLLDCEDKMIGNIAACHDILTKQNVDTIHSDFCEEINYNDKNNSNNQKQMNSTINQLVAMKENHSDYLEKAKTLFMIPDYFNFLLTGNKLCEYTMASTSQLVSPVTGVWDEELISRLGFSRDIFQEIRRPGTVVGNLTRAVTEEVGYDCIIVLPATHAASSAILALPPKEHLGSWSLIHSGDSDVEYSAAAVGNLLVQMIISHELKDVQSARECVENSFFK